MLQTGRTYHRKREEIGHRSFPSASAALKEAALELAWPTRCAVCDAPGDLICDTCRRALRFYDPWLACATCGAPYGRLQCCACNSYTREKRGQSQEPLYCQSAVLFDGTSGSLIRCYKDSGEQRLGALIANMMMRAPSPEAWKNFDAISFIPSTEEALLRRGFDHMETIAEIIAQAKGLPLLQAFQRPSTTDQRTLTQRERHANMESAFILRPQVAALGAPPRILLVDDVMTTGATLEAAAMALRNGGASSVQGLTFARVI